jgi:tetratricopeptide (TPR) repeat protein
MAEQLDLFGMSAPRAAAPRREAAPTSAPAAQPASGEPGLARMVLDAGLEQMDLFGDRWLHASAAHEALRAFDLEAATVALWGAVDLYPSDAELRQRAEQIEALGAALDRALSTEPSRAHALASVRDWVPPFIEARWHQAIAQAIEDEGGPGASLGSTPAGFYWLRAGLAFSAETSLRATLALDATSARVRAYLGDALIAQDRRPEARILYRDALVMAPGEIDLDAIADASVRGLPEIARLDYELADGPIEWAAAIGLVEGVFTPPTPTRSWLDTSELDSLAPGQRLYRWLVAEPLASGEERIAARRAIKALSPSVLKAWLERD